MLQTLPIDEHLSELREALARSPVLVLVAPPGAGKTTRLPPALLNEPWLGANRVVVSQPRRVAARAAARRVVQETGSALGSVVGFAVRGESRFTPSTRLLYCTEGILGATIQADPFLTGVGAVILDEFHERSLEADLALAMLKEIRGGARPDLRLVVCSATLDPGRVADYLGAKIVSVPGRLFPVEISYLDRQPSERLSDEVAAGVKSVFTRRPEGRGDVLVFLPGAGEIRRAGEALKGWAETRGVKLLTLHGDLPAGAQDEVLTPSPTPRVILSTNVAETSLTIDGVAAVVDSGLVNLAEYDPALGFTRLTTVRAARANAGQRAGRAGRTGPGVALRLWTRHEEATRQESLPPEVARADLSRAVLELSAWGHPDPASFDWFERPDPERLADAGALLRELGALSEDGHPTAEGRRMLALPLGVRLARLAVEAARRGVGKSVSLLAAVMEGRDVSLAGRAFGSGSGELHRSDPLLRMELVERAAAMRFSRPGCREAKIDAGAAEEASREAERLVRLMGGRGAGEATEEELLRLIFDAFPDRVGKLDRESGRYLLASGGRAALSQGSSVKGEEFIVAVRLDAGRRGERSEGMILWGSAVEERWLLDSGRTARDSETFFDRERERVAAREVTRYGAIILKSAQARPDPELAYLLLLEEAARDPLAALKPSERAQNLMARMAFLAKALPGGRFRPPDGGALRAILEELCHGISSFRELREADLAGALTRRLTPEERRLLEREAPERVHLPSGRDAPLSYSGEAGPSVTAKIQEVFGLSASPRLAEGRVPLLFTLVGPSGRPLQVTSDLASFWKNGYPMVLKEMKGRYPKHYWPENPYEATPVLRTVKPRR